MKFLVGLRLAVLKNARTASTGRTKVPIKIWGIIFKSNEKNETVIL